MRVESFMKQDGTWQGSFSLQDADLVLFFSATTLLRNEDIYAQLREHYPNAQIAGGSTGGEIFADDVLENSVVGAALKLEQPGNLIRATSAELVEDFDAVGLKISTDLLAFPNLKAVFILSDGLNLHSSKIDGTGLVRTFAKYLPPHIQVTGGMAADSTEILETYVGLDSPPTSRRLLAIGFYGDKIQATSGCMGGWQPFGPLRKITKSSGAVLYELDGKPALELYKSYMGEEAQDLPASGLRYPLEIRPHDNSDPADRVVRTMLNMNEEDQSMTFSGDIPQGAYAQLMNGQFSHLVDGAEQAAEQAKQHDVVGDTLALLVSCVGRKAVMGQLISDETAAVAETLDNAKAIIGYYSYGEIAPKGFTGECYFHNQTMTITVLSEHS